MSYRKEHLTLSEINTLIRLLEDVDPDEEYPANNIAENLVLAKLNRMASNMKASQAAKAKARKAVGVTPIWRVV